MTNFKKTKVSIKVGLKSIKRDHCDRLASLQVFVKDNVQGILKNTRTHMLESFYHLNRSHIHQSSRESGLDLAIITVTLPLNYSKSNTEVFLNPFKV